MKLSTKLAVAAGLGAALALGPISDANAVKRGGVLTFTKQMN